MEKVQVEIIKNEAIINIQLSGSFYRRVQQALHVLAATESQETITELINKINNETPDEEMSEWENAVETLMILCSEVEAKAKEQGHTEMIDVDVAETTTPPAANL